MYVYVFVKYSIAFEWNSQVVVVVVRKVLRRGLRKELPSTQSSIRFISFPGNDLRAVEQFLHGGSTPGSILTILLLSPAVLLFHLFSSFCLFVLDFGFIGVVGMDLKACQVVTYSATPSAAGPTLGTVAIYGYLRIRESAVRSTTLIFTSFEIGR